MKTKILLSAMALAIMVSAIGQRKTIELTFTAIDSAAYVKLDSVKVINRTQGGDTVIYWPDTTVSIEITPGDLLLYVGYSTSLPVGVQAVTVEKEQFQLFQNYPNPVKDNSQISMYLPEKGTVHISVADVQGRAVHNSAWQLGNGNHTFRFKPGEGSLFFLTAWWNGESRSIKIICTEPEKGMRWMLEYKGSSKKGSSLKASPMKPDMIVEESGILDKPETNETYTFQFATNIPCPGTPTVDYEGQVYNTIQVYSQCWLIENLNVGIMVNGGQNQINDGIIEKYCYNNQPDSCTKYGGLYQWNEMMKYTTQQGTRGICPTGWHIPTLEEWRVLDGAADSQYGIGDTIWGNADTGFDAGKNLKATSGWKGLNGNGTDLFGFSGLPGGWRFPAGFDDIGFLTFQWTSTEQYIEFGWEHELWFNTQEAVFGLLQKYFGHSVRCLKND